MRTLMASILAGIAAWTVIFGWRPANFWLLMGAGLALLGAFALWVRGASLYDEGFRVGDLGVGVAAAMVLYLVFFVGRPVLAQLVPDAAAQIGSIYALRAQAPWWVIVPLLVCVIAPGEELFWRGLVQWGLVRELGPSLGWAVGTAIYGGVHAAARNPMLVVAALAAGGFWGWLYLRTGRIAPVIVSHVLWDLVVFFIVPLR